MNRNSWVAVIALALGIATGAYPWLSGYYFGLCFGIVLMKLVGLPYEATGERRNER